MVVLLGVVMDGAVRDGLVSVLATLVRLGIGIGGFFNQPLFRLCITTH